MTVRLSLIIPCGPHDESICQRLLTSIARQDFPKAQLETLVIREGNSEEAKALGVLQAQGDILGFLCTDNDFLEPDFLTTMYQAARSPEVVGAYTRRYAYIPTDTSLSRYFSLLGANDPLCWWLKKADRESYMEISREEEVHHFLSHIPSLGDNGFFIKRQAVQLVIKSPSTFGSCMDMCEDLRQLGYATYGVVSSHALWHRTGESLSLYLRKRWRYTNELYFDKLPIRSWRMVSSARDWAGCLLFAFASVLVVPHLLISLCGYRLVKDAAWFIHPACCLALTCLYTCTLMRYLVWSSVRLIVPRNWQSA